MGLHSITTAVRRLEATARTSPCAACARLAVVIKPPAVVRDRAARDALHVGARPRRGCAACGRPLEFYVLSPDDPRVHGYGLRGEG